LSYAGLFDFSLSEAQPRSRHSPFI
jgi:hypothetical protein